MEGQTAARMLGILCMGMTFALATATLVIVTWLAGGADASHLRALAVHPLALFAVGVGVRSLGSIVARGTRRWWPTLLGDLAATLVVLLISFAVAGVHDTTGIVTSSMVIIIPVALVAAALASTIATAMSRFRPLLVGCTFATACVFVAAIGAQGMTYWPASAL